MKRDATQKAYEYIKTSILTFRLLPQVKISDEDVAKSLGTSRTPVREALNRLSQDGLVIYKRNRGFVVNKFTKKEVMDLYVLRETLEKLAVELTIENLTDKKANGLQKAFSTYSDNYLANNLIKANKADIRFHDLIAKYSGNAALYETIKQILNKITVIRRYDHFGFRNLQDAIDEHKAILDFIIEKNILKAQQAMSKHISNTMKDGLKLLNI
jgi:DNA-binding GntR family transcriptional regulator